jgi:tetratricopeptide (TPR) repeat protein
MTTHFDTTVGAARRQADSGWTVQQDEAKKALGTGRYSEAASLFLAAIEQAEKLRLDDVRLSESLDGLAQSYRYQQKFAEAEVSAQRALLLLETGMGRCIRILFRLSSTWQEQHEARESLRKRKNSMSAC